jgi:hypothetical protein
VKTHTKHVCKKELWAEALGNKRKHECNGRAYLELILNIDGKVTTLSAAFHMDKAPMTLLGTAGSSKQAPPVMWRRVYMTQGGDLVRWTGEFKQHDICYLYRSSFNAVDVHNKLAVGPRSVCNVASSSLPLKLFLYLIACAETNAHLMYMHHHKLSSETYNHSDFKLDLERELFQLAQEDCAVSEEEAEVQTSHITRSVASGGTGTGTQTMPARFQGHALTRHQDKHRKCMVCGNRAKWFCAGGRAISGTPGDRMCYAWHLDAVMNGNLEEGALQWQCGKRGRV